MASVPQSDADGEFTNGITVAQNGNLATGSGFFEELVCRALNHSKAQDQLIINGHKAHDSVGRTANSNDIAGEPAIGCDPNQTLSTEMHIKAQLRNVALSSCQVTPADGGSPVTPAAGLCISVQSGAIEGPRGSIPTLGDPSYWYVCSGTGCPGRDFTFGGYGIEPNPWGNHPPRGNLGVAGGSGTSTSVTKHYVDNLIATRL